ncbi:beta-1,4-galactosyltransferase 1 isoform X3 [Hyperolius riggenbachi]|uniref:beta-1,4-galactosyltransferase 1 isoform X3 n=1 Tax=Hyperolius riggenbachi TaxID=752182 RepID=UPI0035A292B4
MKDPLLSGSSAAVLPGTSLQKACKLLVFFCAIHLSVTLVYYMSGSELNLLQFFTDHPQYRKANGSNFTAGSPLSTVITRLGESAATTGVTTEPSVLPDCPETSPLLVGPLRIEFSISVDLEEVRKTNPNVKAGGRYKPKNCKALQKVAMIIPFRKRDEHLKYWLYYLHPILQRQQLDYGVYVINQDGDSTFNRAKLLNIGYAEALKEYDYSCFVFSDVDIIPMDDRNIYKCYSQPRHLSVSMDKFGFGIVSRGMSISRPDAVTGKCRMIRHERDSKNDPNPQRFDLIARTRQTMDSDGLNSLTYEVIRTEKYPLYTKITVNVGPVPS